MRMIEQGSTTGGPMKTLLGLVLVLVLSLSVAAAQRPYSRADATAVIQANRSQGYNPQAPQGLFDLITYVDGEAIIYIKDTGIHYLMLSGSPLQDAGSNYTQPIPHAAFSSFTMEKIAGRGTVTLVEQPNPGNDFNAVVRINDTKGGRDLYHVRLRWSWNPSNPSRPTGGAVYAPPLDSHDNRSDHYDHAREGEFSFRGRVDGVTVLHIHADQVRSEVLSGQPVRDQRFQFSQPMPTGSLREIALTDVSGRGKVELVEKPWEGNRYTAVVRITDNSPGEGQYSFRLTWRR